MKIYFTIKYFWLLSSQIIIKYRQIITTPNKTITIITNWNRPKLSIYKFWFTIFHYSTEAGPDLGLGKLGSCPGFRTGQLSRGLNNQGPRHMSCHLLFLGYSRVGWASTAPLLKAVQGSPQPGGLHMSCHLLFLGYSRVGWASTAPLLKAAQGPPHV